MPILFLVDNSALQRIRQPSVAAALRALSDLGELSTCTSLVLEAGYGARNLADHKRVIRDLAAWVLLAPDPDELHRTAVALQRKLFTAGKGRSVGVIDLDVAAHALCCSESGVTVTLVHYDRDYDHLVEVEPKLSAVWVVPSGTVP